VAVAVAVAVLAGCGGSDEPSRDRADRDRPRAEREREPDRPTEPRRPARPAAPACPQGAANCGAAAGRVIALESVDADGDGDLHVIVAGGDVTFPGISVLDVSAALRPARDPRVGDWAAGAGPVYEGSYGQRQIEVDAVVFDPPRG
jgi:pyruvate/2-oxoglutarate dehydrogenase complex dihydrolipoamide acyltransferase (E2) component